MSEPPEADPWSNDEHPPDGLTAALYAHVAAGLKRYGLDTRSLKLESLSYSSVEATRSFTARDFDLAVHVKLWNTEQQTIRDRWLDVHAVLESRHHARRR